MTQYLLDTNVLLRLCNPADPQHEGVTNAISTLLIRTDECYLSPQVLVEFWVVATRPNDVNGLGWSVEQTRSVIERLINRFPLIEETPQLFTTWLNLVTENKVKGKRTHDARIVALMISTGIIHILTLNSDDFKDFIEITSVNPQELV